MSSNVKVYGSFHFAESCTFDPDRNVILAMNAGESAKPGQSAAAEPNDGFVSLIKPDGSVHTSKWIGATRDGLTLVHPLGSAIQGGTLYINDGNTIRTFDLKTGTPKQAFEVKEATNLNGIGVATDGTIYASNTGNAQQPENKQRIYNVHAERPSVGVRRRRAAAHCRTASRSTRRQRRRREHRQQRRAHVRPGRQARADRARGGSGNDGVVVLPDGTKYVSSVRFGSVSRIAPGREAEVIATGIPAAASMCYDSRQNQLVIPLNPNNALGVHSARPALAPSEGPLGRGCHGRGPSRRAAAQPPPTGGCDRSCLEGFLDGYIEAVVAHDARRLPPAPTIEFTENGQRLSLDDGVGSRQLAEIETLVIPTAKSRDGSMTLALLAPRRRRRVAAGDRRSRAELLHVANAISGIERNDGRGDYPLAADCARLENGLVLAGDVALVSPRAKGRPTARKSAASSNSGAASSSTSRAFATGASCSSIPSEGSCSRSRSSTTPAAIRVLGTLPDGRNVESRPEDSVDLADRRSVQDRARAPSAPSSRCCIKSRTAWAPAGARGKSRCRASRGADLAIAAGSVRVPHAPLVDAAVALERHIAVLPHGLQRRGVEPAARVALRRRRDSRGCPAAIDDELEVDPALGFRAPALRRIDDRCRASQRSGSLAGEAVAR